jgi:hypothetical protein
MNKQFPLGYKRDPFANVKPTGSLIINSNKPLNLTSKDQKSSEYLHF